MEQLYLKRAPRSTRPQITQVSQSPRVIMVDPPRRNIKLERIALFGSVFIVLVILIGIALKATGVTHVAEMATSVPVNAVPTVVVTVVPTPIPPVEVLSRVFQPTVLRWEPLIVEAAWRYGFDPNLLAIVVQIESCGDPTAVSHAGAMGLGQVMPFHFAAGENPYDPATNLNRAAAYFAAGLKSSNNDIGLTFAGYNGGHGTVQKGRQFWAAETARYYEWATGIFWDLKNGEVQSPTIQRWLQAGGNSLCEQAATRS